MAYLLGSEIVEITVQQGTTFNISFRAFVLIIHRLIHYIGLLFVFYETGQRFY